MAAREEAGSTSRGVGASEGFPCSKAASRVRRTSRRTCSRGRGSRSERKIGHSNLHPSPIHVSRSIMMKPACRHHCGCCCNECHLSPPLGSSMRTRGSSEDRWTSLAALPTDSVTEARCATQATVEVCLGNAVRTALVVLCDCILYLIMHGSMWTAVLGCSAMISDRALTARIIPSDAAVCRVSSSSDPRLKKAPLRKIAVDVQLDGIQIAVERGPALFSE